MDNIFYWAVNTAIVNTALLLLQLEPSMPAAYSLQVHKLVNSDE